MARRRDPLRGVVDEEVGAAGFDGVGPRTQVVSLT
jgi:hypothetical protein